MKSISGDFFAIAEYQEIYYDPGPTWYYMGDAEKIGHFYICQT